MDEQELQQLESDLQGKALHKQKAALDRLATLAPEVALPILDRASRSSDFMIRRAGVMGLGNHRTPAAFDRLAEIITEEQDANVVAEAADAIFDLGIDEAAQGGNRAISILVEAFKPQRWLVRHTVLALLLETTCYQELWDLTQVALGDENQAVKENGIAVLGRLLRSPFQSAALEKLTELCDDPDWRNRWRAAIALQSLNNDSTQALMARLRQDEHFRVVAAALEVSSHWAES